MRNDNWRCDACAMLGRGLGVEDISVRLAVDVADVRRLVSALRESGQLMTVLETGRIGK